MVRSVLASWWREPPAADPPARVWRDWVLLAALLLTALLEGALRSDVVWRPLVTAAALAVVPVVLWRRTHPLAVVVTAFGTLLLLTAAGALDSSPEPVGLYTNAFVLLLSYSLLRWGSGREVVLGLAVMLLTAAASTAAEWTGPVDAVAGTVFLLFPAAVGLAVRSWYAARARELVQVKTGEREQLARELHDTVAHHVSAIAVRAQAGQVVAEQRPEAALEALAVIEQEASRTLEEMRSIVGVLRDGDRAERAPQRGVADIPGLAGHDQPRVRVALEGDLVSLAQPVGAALYRIAQESVTNAVQHARGATRVDVAVIGTTDSVRLTVSDDGTPAAGRGPGGYGLVGMTERATLLGGSLLAGPRAEGGWCVEAVIPRGGAGR